MFSSRPAAAVAPTSASTSALSARGLRYRVAGRTILDDLSLDVGPPC
ncbi:hypothetical protein ABT143_08510 [Streptomyces sp. NPDC002033]